LHPKWTSSDSQPLLDAACLKQGIDRLTDIKRAVPPTTAAEDLRFVVAHLRAENRVRAKSA